MQVEETQTSNANLALKPTRASFIRSLPISMPVEEVIERAREAGIQVQPSDVHAARYYMRQASAAEAASKPPSIAQQLMLGGTISAQREPRDVRENREQDETAGLTKIAGVRNGAAKPVTNGAAKPVTNGAAAKALEAQAVEPPPAKRERESRVQTRVGRSKQADKQVDKKAAKSADRALVEISIDDVLQSVPMISAPKGRVRRATASTVSGSMEEQLHQLVVRLGTQRARELIDEIEDTALSAS